MFPSIPTTPFKNSPSIDPLSPHPRQRHRRSHTSTSSSLSHSLAHSVELESESSQELVGDKTLGTDVPVDLLRSVILTNNNNTPKNKISPNQIITTPIHSPSTSLIDSHHQSIADRWNVPTIAYAPTQIFPPIRHLPGHDRKRILVTGGAGFVGSHLVDRLMFMGHDVTVLDNFFSGSKTAVAHWIGHPNFEMIRHDVVDPFMIECDQIYHLACPASPVAYQYNSIKTMKTNFLGTMNMLGLAKRTKARLLLSSTSEVYGSPEQHPQKETYWGNVNPIGPRACYDEGKRVAEALTYGYGRENGVSVRVARIFNTYGPRMSPSDGRLVSNFIMAAIRGNPLEVYGDGSQTRSLMYVLDLIDGLIKLMNSDHPEVTESPVNLGSDDEQSVSVWANQVIDIVKDLKLEESQPDLSGHNSSLIILKPALPDDPPRRRPDTSKALHALNWSPQWSAKDGLRDTAKFFLDVVNSGYSS